MDIRLASTSTAGNPYSTFQETARYPETPFLQTSQFLRMVFAYSGVQLVPPLSVMRYFRARVSKIKETLRTVHDMQDSQLETTILRSCLALPKVTYVLRTCPPSHIVGATRDFDMAIREAFEGILGLRTCPPSHIVGATRDFDMAIREAFEGILGLGGPCPEWSWLKASLPSSRGGINLRPAAVHAPAAFIASTTSCKVLCWRGYWGIHLVLPNISTKLLPLFLLPPLAQTGNSWTTSMCRCSSTTCPWLSTKPSIANYFRPHLQFVPVLSLTPPAFHMRVIG